MGIYIWDLPERGMSGVTDDAGRARRLLGDALLEAPIGAEGTVRSAVVNSITNSYEYTDPIVTGRRAADGGLVWTDGGVV
jgi:hypothetical protein